MARSGPALEILFGLTGARPSRHGEFQIDRDAGETAVGFRDSQPRPPQGGAAPQCELTSAAETVTSEPGRTSTLSCQGMKPLLWMESRWRPGSMRKLHGVRHRTVPSATSSSPGGCVATFTVPACGPGGGGAGGGASARVQAAAVTARARTSASCAPRRWSGEREKAWRFTGDS